MHKHLHEAAAFLKQQGRTITIFSCMLSGIAALHAESLRFEAALPLALKQAQLSELEDTAGQAARARIQAAKALPNPSAIAEHEYLKGRPGDSEESLIGVSTPLDFLWKRGARIDAAEQFAGIAPQRIAEERRQIRYRLARLYLQTSVVSEQLAALEGAEARLKEAYRLSAALVENGEIPPAQRRRIALAIEQAVTARATLEAEALSHQSAFTALTGLESARPGPLKFDRPSYESAAAAIAEAQANRPDFKALEAISQWRRSEIERSRAEALPEASLDLAYKRDNDSREGGFIGISVEIPIFGKNRAHQHLARSEAFEAEIKLSQLRRQIEGEVAAAFYRYEKLSEKAAHQTQTDDHETYLASELSAFRNGEASVVEYLDAIELYRELRFTEIEHARLREEAALNLIFQTGSEYASSKQISTTLK
ncbi:MAG: TolC family protein [Opitutales bacterium]